MFLCILTTFLINNPFWRSVVEQYKEGDIARESIISPADIYVTDAEETEKIKEAARDSVRPIFIFEPKRSDEAVQSFRSAWENLSRKNDNANVNANAKTNANEKPKRKLFGQVRAARQSAKFSPLENSAPTN